MNLLRGSGSDGLSGMKPVRQLNEDSEVVLVRPMLSWARRSDTETYCRSRGHEFLIDEMNRDERFARVRVRQDLLPLMASFNPKIVESLGRSAELAREDIAVLEKAAGALLHEAQANNQKPSRGRAMQLRVRSLQSAAPALRRRALRQWINECRGDLKRVERVHILAVEGLLFGDHGGRVIELPGGAKIARKRGVLEYQE
jgi:tRNA(Ile)-lysidine synthase